MGPLFLFYRCPSRTPTPRVRTSEIQASWFFVFLRKTKATFQFPQLENKNPSVQVVLICSRSGSICSFELEKGILIWEHNVGDPITSSAYVDENLQLVSNFSLLSDRLICICASSGVIYVLRVPSGSAGEPNCLRKHAVQEFARSVPAHVDHQYALDCILQMMV
ncbi:hypothetical protein U1Q18_048646 [Sarracenia purpurea var. burkii]